MSQTDHRRFWREVFPKFLEATAIWAIVAGAIGWLTWKEINRTPDQVEIGRPVTFIAQESFGVTDGSTLFCQGIAVGEILAVEPVTTPDGNLEIRMDGTIDPRFADWAFSSEAATKAGALSGITGTPIVLTYEGELQPGPDTDPQQLTLTPPEETGERVNRVLTEVTKITTAFTDPIAADKLPADWPPGADPMRIAVIVHNLERATDTLKNAAADLGHELDATDEATLLASLRGIKTNVDVLTTEAATVLGTLDQTVSAIDGKVTDLLGQTSTDRAQPREEINRAIARADELLTRLNALIPRIGDTFLGRRFISKPDEQRAEEATR